MLTTIILTALLSTLLLIRPLFRFAHYLLLRRRFLRLQRHNGGITITGSTGLVAIHATATQTRAIDEGSYYYDLEITSPATPTAVVTRLVQGQAIVSAEVTR